MSDNSGTLVGSVNYNVFGSIRSQSGATSILGFTGEVYNPQTQLLYLRARDYAVTLGRLLSADTVSPNAHEAQGYNLYAYVANNPTTWVDPTWHNALAPPMDNSSLIDAVRQTGDMMKNALQTFSLSLFGAWALDIGAKMGSLVALAGGLSAFNIGVALLVAAALIGLSYLIWACLINQNSWCYKSSTMQSLREMASEGMETLTCNPPQSQFAAAGMAGMALYNPKSAVNSAWRNQNPCAPEPEEEEVKHRGRLQIQGPDLRFEPSWNWARSTPPSKGEALTELTLMWDQLSSREQRDRLQSYDKMQTFIRNGPYLAVLTRSFSDSNRRESKARVDVEIWEGKAFTQ